MRCWLRYGAVLIGLTLSGCGTGVRPGGETATGGTVRASSQGPPARGGRPPMPRAEALNTVPGVRVEVVARNLQIPWALGFAPDGRIFVTERPGRIRVLRSGQAPQSYLNLTSVVHRGEGGLMGLALHPRFPNPPHLYVMYTTRKGGRGVNRISRFTDRGTTADSEQVLVDDIPAAQYHDGGALEFGPDGMLYAGTGDATTPRLSQDRNSLAGKILRIRPDGSIPGDNPFPNSPVWAYGFRNVTGLAWHPETRELWAASHGPSGEFGLRARDTVHIVRKGANHGWPLVVGTTNQPGIVSPVLYYPDEAIPPGGALFYTGSRLPQFRNNFFLTCLGSTHLQRVVVEGGNRIAAIQRWWPGKYGRLRAIEQGPDGAFYFTTSNRDGRARRSYPGSDFIYRVVPAE